MGGLMLGMLAALGWGIGDFYGGVVSRRWPPLLVVLGSMTLATLGLFAALLLRGGGITFHTSLLWGMAAGSIGVFSLTGFFHLLARGNMALSAPITSLTTALVPLFFGIASGGLPASSKIIGIALALLAIPIVSHGAHSAANSGGQPRPTWRVIAEPILVGIGFGVGLIFLDRIESRDLLAPLLALRLTGISALLLTLAIHPRTRRPLFALWQERKQASIVFLPALGWLALIGISDLIANGAFILATQLDSLTIVAVIGSLHPAVTVLLARLIDKEQLRRSQPLGLALCLVAIIFISL